MSVMTCQCDRPALGEPDRCFRCGKLTEVPPPVSEGAVELDARIERTRLALRRLAEDQGVDVRDPDEYGRWLEHRLGRVRLAARA